eukprot:EG_transcript_1285
MVYEKDDDEEEEEEEEEDVGEEEDEDDDDEGKPMLKFFPFFAPQRDGGTTAGEHCTCIAVTPRLVFVGTSCGEVQVLDAVGGHLLRSLVLAPRQGVVALHVDPRGEQLLAVLQDGSVALSSVYGEGQAKVDIGALVHSVAKVSAAANDQWLVGAQTGVWRAWRGRLTRRWKTEPLQAGEGAAYEVGCQGNLAVWATAAGVTVVDVSCDQVILKVPHHERYARLDLLRCSLCWLADGTLLVAWGHWLTRCAFRPRPQFQLAHNARLSPLAGEVVIRFRVDRLLCGVAPFGPHLLLLCLADHALEATAPPVPELMVITPQGEEVSRTPLAWLRRSDSDRLRDFQLQYQRDDPGDPLFYVLTPAEIVTARPADDDDHVAWLLSLGRYPQALQYLQQRGHTFHQPEHSIGAVGHRYLTLLVDDGRYVEAAGLLPLLLGPDASRWEEWFFVFLDRGQLHALAPLLPADPEGLRLSATVYALCLTYLLRTDPEVGLHYVSTWSTALYDVPPLIEALRHDLALISSSASAPLSTQEAALLRALAHLYEASEQYQDALGVYLRLRDEGTFRFVERHALYAALKDHVVPLLEVDREAALRLLAAHVAEVPAHHVVRATEGHRPLQHRYLDALFRQDGRGAVQYHDRQVELYAEFDPAFLLKFLRQSQYIDWAKAREVCRARGLTRATVFIMGRLGDLQAALTLILRDLRDVREAVAFVLEHREEALFESLVALCQGSPELLGPLLDEVTAVEGAVRAVDAVKVVRALPGDAALPGLKQRCVALLHSKAVSRDLRACGLAMVHARLLHQYSRFHADCHAGLLVRPATAHCASCTEVVRSGDEQHAVVFQCGHAFHVGCWHAEFKRAHAARSAQLPGRVYGTLHMDLVVFSDAFGVPPHCTHCHPGQPVGAAAAARSLQVSTAPAAPPKPVPNPGEAASSPPPTSEFAAALALTQAGPSPSSRSASPLSPAAGHGRSPSDATESSGLSTRTGSSGPAKGTGAAHPAASPAMQTNSVVVAC